MITSSTILFFLVTCYVFILALLIRGLSRLNHGSSEAEPLVSVIIAARNEQDNIADCLEALRAQTYALNKHEIIVVNDRSTDATAAIVRSYMAADERFRLINSRVTNKKMSPKKWALHQGIQEARGSLILTTDADATPPPGWISSIVAYFEPDVGLVAGFSPLDRFTTGKLAQKLMALDSLALAAVAAGSYGAGFPLTCTGRNLAYRKRAYTEAGGFTAIGRTISGDDDLFLHLLRKKTQWKMRYAVDAESIVPSKPPENLRAFRHQRTRHASKGRFYPAGLKTGLIGVYLLNLFLLVGWFWPQFRSVLLVSLGVKACVEFILVHKTARLFGRTRWIRLFPLAALLHIPYIVVFGFLGTIGKFEWKARTHRAIVEA